MSFSFITTQNAPFSLEAWKALLNKRTFLHHQKKKAFFILCITFRVSEFSSFIRGMKKNGLNVWCIFEIYVNENCIKRNFFLMFFFSITFWFPITICFFSFIFMIIFCRVFDTQKFPFLSTWTFIALLSVNFPQFLLHFSNQLWFEFLLRHNLAIAKWDPYKTIFLS